MNGSRTAASSLGCTPVSRVAWGTWPMRRGKRGVRAGYFSSQPVLTMPTATSPNPATSNHMAADQARRGVLTALARL